MHGDLAVKASASEELRVAQAKGTCRGGFLRKLLKMMLLALPYIAFSGPQEGP